MKVPFYNSTREYKQRKEEFDAAVRGVMERGDFILGSEVAEFEKEAAAWLGAKYAVGLASGSDALVLASDILGFKDGAEVLTPTFTFFASTSCVARLGGKPVLVDMDEETLNMDLTDAEKKLTKQTIGVIPVHLFQQCTPLGKVMKLAKAEGLKVLEDAAEAWGMKSLVNGTWRMAGTVGDIGIYSFFPTKTLGAYGDAGLAVTDDEELYKKLKSYRVHGSSVKYHHDYIGYNSRLDTMQAAILRVKLKTTDAAIAARARHAEHYSRRLSGLPGLRIPPVASDNKPVYYVYNILLDGRDTLVERFKEKGIGYSIYYPKPLHLQKCFSYLGWKEGDFPVAESVAKRIIALPIYPEITDDEVDYVCDEITAFCR
ncbi:MAG: DegT/DnrJ/EryC1/StrS family aminotransferase [Spirochaetia bacterium]|nr:DegT/DnrJ/EryC1/StrS family aminotransferase [Spirochaetia bacterium]MCE1209617.1 DegT/DnrJ/EryC1/StrS family aminotransferase [Spirochaetia bacterium]